MPYLSKPAWRGKYLPFGQGQMIVAPVEIRKGQPVAVKRLSQNRGLGQTYKQTSDGTIVDCDLLDNIGYSVCWNPFVPEAPASSVPSNNPLPPPLPPPAPVATANNSNPLTLPPASAADANATLNATLAQGMLNNQQMLQNYIQQMQNQGAQNNACLRTIIPSSGICDSTVYLGLGVLAAILVVPPLLESLAGGLRRR